MLKLIFLVLLLCFCHATTKNFIRLYETEFDFEDNNNPKGSYFKLTSGKREKRGVKGEAGNAGETNLLSFRECGKKNTKESSKHFHRQIFGRRDARNGEWPWMAFIDRDHRGPFGGLRGRSFCAGSLVGERHVVTAAHCVTARIRDLRVYLGVTDRFKNSSLNIQEFNVTNIYRHDEFRNQENRFSLFNHDIAVLRLDRPAVIGRYVRPICIPKSPLEISLPEKSIKKGVLIAWGVISDVIVGRAIQDDITIAHVLQVVRLPYVNRSFCEELYNNQSQSYSHYRRVQVTRNHLCAGFLDRSQEPCAGSGGSPLMWRINGKWYLNGIVSFGTSLGGCEPHAIGVYTAVANYYSFIENKISVV